jgi:isopentenyl-diphosphate Delta-isomerase
MSRKTDHIKISLEKDIEVGDALFDDIRLIHNALPELDYDKIKLDCKFLGKKLKAPLVIEAITGGTKEALEINKTLARAAESCNIAIGVGSQRSAIDNPKLEDTFSIVAKEAPNAFKIANLGAVQLNYGYSVKECQRAIDMIAADALALHLNPLQELIQPEGDKNFSALLEKISNVIDSLDVPVIIKEVGCGLSRTVVEKLICAGVVAVDLAGFGGTSWNLIEAERNPSKKELSETFREWGNPTTVTLLETIDLEITKIASGGIRNGLDIAKSLVLGADLAGMALPFLKVQQDGEKAVEVFVHKRLEELKTAMLLTGSEKVTDLSKREFTVTGKAAEMVIY